WLETLALANLGDEDSLGRLLGRSAMDAFTSLELYWEESDSLGILDWLDRERMRRLRLGNEQQSDVLLRKLAQMHSLRPQVLEVYPERGCLSGWEALMASPVLSEVRSLECGIPTGAPVLALLAGAKHLTRLTRLILCGDAFPEASLHALFHSSALEELVD